MDTLNRILLTHRRIIVPVLAGIAVWSAIAAITHKPASDLIAVAARDLPSGSSIEDSDIEMTSLPRSSVPLGMLSRKELRDRVVAGPMRKGEPFTDHRAINPHRLDSGEQLALIDVPVNSARLLRVGDRVDLVALDTHDGKQNTTLATAAPIALLEIPSNDTTASVGVALPAALAHDVMASQLQSALIVLPTSFP